MTETTRQRLAYDRYWTLGAGRSIERLHEAMTETGDAPTLRTLYEWSRAYHWQQRIAELEREARREQEEARLRAMREMFERQAKEGILLQQKGTEWLMALLGGDVTAEAAIRAIAEGAKLERLARGEPGNRQEFRGTSDEDEQYSQFSPQQLRAFLEAMGGFVEKSGEERSE